MENVGNSGWLTAHRLLAAIPRPPGVVLIFLLLLAGGWLIAFLGLFQITPPPPRGDEIYLFRLLSREAAEALLQLDSARHTPVSAWIKSVFWLAAIWLPLGLLLAIFRRQADSWLVGKIPGHVLVFGSGPALLSIMGGKRLGNIPSLALLNEGSQSLRKKLDELKLPWRSQQDKQEILSRSLLTPGASIFACDEDDTANIHLVDLVGLLATRNRCAYGVSLMVRISDGQLRRQLSDRYMARPELRQLRLVVYSDHDLRSRLAARNWPAFHFCHAELPDQAHLVVVGEGYPAESMLVQLLKSSRFPAGMSVLFSWVSPDASKSKSGFQSRYPELAGHYDIGFFSLDSGNYSDWMRWLTRQFEQDTLPTACYLASTNGAQQMNWALALEDAYKLEERAIPPVILLNAGAQAEQPGSGDRLAGSPMFRYVEDINRVEQGELVSQLRLDRMARSIHEGYVRESLAGGAQLGDWPSLVAWEDLSEMMKDENRDQADHNLIKLGLMGLSLSREESEIPRMDDGLIEQVSRVEHDRWLASRRSRGWTYGEPRDDSRLRHPDMVPWEDLSEATRDKDRDMVTQFPGLMQSMHISLKPLMFLQVESEGGNGRQELEQQIENAVESAANELSGFCPVLIGSPTDSTVQAAYQVMVKQGQSRFFAVLETGFPETGSAGPSSSETALLHPMLDRSSGIIAGHKKLDLTALAGALPLMHQCWLLLKLARDGTVQKRSFNFHKREKTVDGRTTLELQESAC